MKVKICGITSYEDARLALDAGAWALGFVFHSASRRRVEPEEVRRITRRLPAGALTVGVFVDWPLADLQELLAAAELRGAQLHGSEAPAYAAAVQAELVIKALRVGEDFDPEPMRSFPGCQILLDTFKPGIAGGTGERFDWRQARRAGEIAPVILAGGLDPENVAAALEVARPAGIDVSSGVESAPGVKDREKLARLFRAVEQAARLEPGKKEDRTW